MILMVISDWIDNCRRALVRHVDLEHRFAKKKGKDGGRSRHSCRMLESRVTGETPCKSHQSRMSLRDTNGRLKDTVILKHEASVYGTKNAWQK